MLLEDEVSCLSLVINQGLWAKPKDFESRALVTEGTRTGFAMLVLSKLTLLDLSRLCVRLCLLEKMGETHILLCESNTFEKHPCLCCMDQFLRDIRWNLMGNSGSEKVYVWGLPRFAKVLRHHWIYFPLAYILHGL